MPHFIVFTLPVTTPHIFNILTKSLFRFPQFLLQPNDQVMFESISTWNKRMSEIFLLIVIVNVKYSFYGYIVYATFYEMWFKIWK